MDNTELQYGCRSEYGPLELLIQITASSSGFMIYVEDSRLEHARVFEHAVQSTLESAKESAVVRAEEYLNSLKEASQHTAKWRCS